jgi:nitrogen fixation/metabolism regulation signal transduction histidine kinase
MVLGFAVLSFTLTRGLYISSIALALLMVVLTLVAYRHQQLLHYERQQVVRENAELHDRIVEGQRRLQFMQHLAENVETALIVVAPTGRIDWCNDAARLLLGDQPSSLPSDIAEAVAQGRDEVDGMVVSATQLRIEGRPRTIVTLKNIQRQVERHEMETWRQLTRVLAHEILNSITPVITITESMKAGHEDTELGMGLSVIDRRCRSLLAFVESYRQLARVEAPQKTTFEAAELMSDL